MVEIQEGLKRQVHHVQASSDEACQACETRGITGSLKYVSPSSLRWVSSENYEKRKARGQCASKASCKFSVVPGYTCCAFHLRKSAEATARGRGKK